MLFFERLLKYKLHRVTSKVGEPRRGLRKVCSWPDVVYTVVNVKKNNVYSLYLDYLN